MTAPVPPHHRADGRFQNPWLNGRDQRLRAFLRWRLERLRRPPPPDPEESPFRPHPPANAAAAPRAAAERLTLTWVGHSTFLIRIGGLHLLTDPVWSERVSPIPLLGPRRRVPPGVALEAPPPIDVVLLSHNHYDHLDVPTVRRLVRRHPQARWFVPLGLGEFLRRRGVRTVRELDWWEEARVGDAVLGCTPAQHFSARGLGDRNRALWCGWAVAAPAGRLFFAGDTGYHPEFARIDERFGPFHVALMPIGAYEPRWFMQPVHMNPEESVRAFRDLTRGRNAVMVPMHWGTFRLTDEPLDEPPRRAARAWREAGLPFDDLWILAPGETRGL